MQMTVSNYNNCKNDIDDAIDVWYVNCSQAD